MLDIIFRFERTWVMQLEQELGQKLMPVLCWMFNVDVWKPSASQLPDPGPGGWDGGLAGAAGQTGEEEPTPGGGTGDQGRWSVKPQSVLLFLSLAPLLALLAGWFIGLTKSKTSRLNIRKSLCIQHPAVWTMYMFQFFKNRRRLYSG